MGEIHELLVLALFLVWFAGATPETKLGKPIRNFSIDPASSIRTLRGPINQLNAVLSLLHPLDRHRIPLR